MSSLDEVFLFLASSFPWDEDLLTLQDFLEVHGQGRDVVDVLPLLRRSSDAAHCVWGIGCYRTALIDEDGTVLEDERMRMKVEEEGIHQLRGRGKTGPGFHIASFDFGTLIVHYWGTAPGSDYRGTLDRCAPLGRGTWNWGIHGPLEPQVQS